MKRKVWVSGGATGGMESLASVSGATTGGVESLRHVAGSATGCFESLDLKFSIGAAALEKLEPEARRLLGPKRDAIGSVVEELKRRSLGDPAAAGYLGIVLVDSRARKPSQRQFEMWCKSRAGLTQKDIGSKLGVSQSTVSRAIKRVEEFLATRGASPLFDPGSSE